MKIVVGFGNPGRQYQNNRHNVGFRCVDFIAAQHQSNLKRTVCQSHIGAISISGCDVLLVKPRTFVNLTGDAVSCLLKKYAVAVSDLITIYDDLDIPVGRIRLRMGGSSGGHRGIQSVINRTGSRDFNRVRIGISRPEPDAIAAGDNEIVDYVLGDFTRHEETIIMQALETAAEAVSCIITENIDIAMTRFNRRKSV